MSNLRRIEISDIEHARKLIQDIGCDPKSIEIMAPKAVFRTLLIEDVHPIDAMIIKQDMLSLGGEVAIPKDVFERRDEKCKILVMGTLRQLKDLVGKLYRHHSRIKTIAKELEDFLEEEYEGSESRKKDL
ncbi:MAG: hypothetical protein DRN25_04275 [Thermoplasmata archaeon]|nr:MAG: hypothetical protein DRN25_04275 [Thermoplasmata archaeon]